MRMRYTNSLAVEWLLDNGYDHVWLKSHTKFKDMTYTKEGSYRSMDIWNLFDGCCIGPNKEVVFLQIKTNAWPHSKPIESFMENKHIQVLALNCKKVRTKYIIHTRSYPQT